MRLVIIGHGLLGQSLVDASYEECCDYACYEDERCACRGCETRVLTHSDVDIASESSIRAMLNLHRPDVVINTAAIHRLAECEADPQRAFDVNARAAERLAKLVPTVYISTDYVFNEGGPHDESLPGQQPRSVYGRSKLAGEMATLEHGGIVVRVAALFGHHLSHKGPTFPAQVLSDHAPMKLPTDQVFTPTYAPDAAGRILDLALDSKATGIYHAANRGSTNWAEFAEHILAHTRHDRHVLPYEAHDKLRPRDSSLVSRRLPGLPHWVDGLGRWAQTEGHFRFVSPKRDE